MRPGTLLRVKALGARIADELAESHRLLDLGGYDGALSSELVQLKPGLQPLVLDQDMDGLRASAERNLLAVQGSGENIPSGESTFDVVLCLDVIEHLSAPGPLLLEVSRVLKPGGKLILTTPIETGVSFPFMTAIQSRRLNRSWGHVRLGFSTAELNEYLAMCGFTLLKSSKYFNIISRLIYRIVFLSFFQRLKLDWAFALVVPFERYCSLGGQEHYVVAVKSDREFCDEK